MGEQNTHVTVRFALDFSNQLSELFEVKKIDSKLLSEYIKHLETEKKNGIEEMCSKSTMFNIFCDCVEECNFANLEGDDEIKENAEIIDKIRHEFNNEKKVGNKKKKNL